MRTSDAVRHMIQESGQSQRGVSLALGKSAGYIGASFAQADGDWKPLPDTLAAVARACGWSLVLEKGDQRIELG